MKRRLIICISALALAAGIFAVLLITKISSAPEGYKEIQEAQRNYEKLDSASLVMTDNLSGDTLMTFRFLINGDNEMILDYYAPQSGERAYSDGKLFRYKTDGEWTTISPSSEEYIHNLYNREYRYPYARGSVFFADSESVSEAEISQNGGKTVITYIYDAERLNQKAGQLLLENAKSFSRLQCEYTLEDGLITNLTEKGVITDLEDKEITLDITIRLLEINEVKSIEKPFD